LSEFSPDPFDLDPGVAGHQMTHVIEVHEDGEPMDLSPAEHAVKAQCIRVTGTGATAYAPTVTIPAQVDRNKGRMQVLHSAAQLATAGRYRLNVYIGASGAALSATEPLKRRFYKFTVHDADGTE